MPSSSRERARGGPGVASFAQQQQQRQQQRHLHLHRHRHPHATTTTTTTTATATATIHEDGRYPTSPDTRRVLPRAIDIGGANGSRDENPRGEPRPKKRKLSIRTTTTNHKLESFGFRAQPKPAATITRDLPPHDALPSPVNGVGSAVAGDEDELSLDSAPLPVPMPKRATRSPVPAPAPSLLPAPEKRSKEERRSLRSHDDGPRLKSELAVYFPNYEDVMFDVLTGDEDFLTLDSTLYIAEDTAKKKDGEPSPAKAGKKAAPSRRISVNGTGQPAALQTSASTMSNASVNLDFLAKTSSDTPDDPLTDAHFLKSHNRAERKEKQLRNIERERAMHEKVQLERLLDGLQGHDWLRVLGITGITDGEAKKYELKRDYFVVEVKALIDKFAQWKAQEKKLRLRKEAAHARQDATDEGGSTASSVEPPSSDLNASAARQLLQETVNAVKASSSKQKGKLPAAAAATSHPSTPTSTPGFPRMPPPPPLPPSPEVPITSFYAKRHLRDAALSKSSRQTTRNITAFGHPVPDLPEQEFSLPEDLVTPDVLRANARERRRRKRESGAGSSSASK